MRSECILINPWSKSVTKVNVDTSDVVSVYRVMTPAFLPAEQYVNDLMVACSYPNGDNLILDPEAGAKGWTRGFSLGQVTAIGCGLIIGVTDKKEFTACSSMLVYIQDHIKFISGEAS